jgi:hypothetical protein
LLHPRAIGLERFVGATLHQVIEIRRIALARRGIGSGDRDPSTWGTIRITKLLFFAGTLFIIRPTRISPFMYHLCTTASSAALRLHPSSPADRPQ